MKKQIGWISIILFTALACRFLTPGGGGTATPQVFTQEINYSNGGLGLTIPAGWRITLEAVNLSDQDTNDYYGLGVKPYFVIEKPSQAGGAAFFFTIAVSPLAGGETLESRYTRAYEDAIPTLEKVTEQTIEIGQVNAYQIDYERPWGEPRWKFKDVWMEKDGQIYVLSFRGSPITFDSNLDDCNLLISSFHFEE